MAGSPSLPAFGRKLGCHSISLVHSCGPPSAFGKRGIHSSPSVTRSSLSFSTADGDPHEEPPQAARTSPSRRLTIQGQSSAVGGVVRFNFFKEHAVLAVGWFAWEIRKDLPSYQPQVLSSIRRTVRSGRRRSERISF